jgi:hypothetical protein
MSDQSARAWAAIEADPEQLQRFKDMAARTEATDPIPDDPAWLNACPHRGRIWEPPRNVVDQVACPYVHCKAKPKHPCVEKGRRREEPHAIRYVAHHEATCGQQEWSR